MQRFFKIILLTTICSLMAACTLMTPDGLKSRPPKAIQKIGAPRQVVLQCLSSELKKSISSIYTVVEAPNDVQLMLGSTTIRLYEVSDAAGGTVITLYITNNQQYVDEAKELISRCQTKLAQQ